MASHHDTIRDQFTKQAIPFATAPSVRDEDALKLLVDLAGAGPDDLALDVACGPGLVTCAFARVVRHATGIDLTPAMIDRARELARSSSLANATFEVGDVLPLPFGDASFSIVTCRYAFHHFLDPLAALREMRRVCRPGGRVAVADVAASLDGARADAFNRMERLRDPSHVRAMPLPELTGLFTKAGFPEPNRGFYRFEADVEGLIERSFPEPGDVPIIRQMFVDSLANDGLGMETRRDGDKLRCTYPISILVAPVPSPETRVGAR